MSNKRPLTSDSYLENVILNTIDKSIQTIELRMLINLQSSVPLSSLLQRDEGGNIDFSKIQSGFSQNHIVENTVVECNESIEKLRLIKDSITHLTQERLFHYIQNYTFYSLEELRYKMNAHLARRIA